MLNNFRQFIEEHKLCRKEQLIYLAVSGGVDSMVMLDLFLKGGFEIAILHCNFQLRGAESDKDEQLVIDEAKKHTIKVQAKKFHTDAFASTHGLSIQLAARQLRYDWFAEVLDEKNDSLLATAHHLNDQLETILFNLARGTGISGLSGIPIKVNRIIRPLLFANRREIEDYANKENIQWREDASNESVKYQRNFIRHDIVPKMEMVNPSLLETFGRTSQRLRESENILKNHINEIREKHLIKAGNDYIIDLKLLEEQNASFVELILKPFNVSFSEAEDILQSVQNKSVGAIFPLDDHILNVDREQLIISPLQESIEDSFLYKDHSQSTEQFSIKTEDIDSYKIIPHASIAALDYDKLIFPLKVRPWQEGDKFIPLGMRGKKKLSDFIIDNKIAVNLKNRILVVESDGDIVWVVGHRIDERYKITADTNTVYQIQWHS